MSAFRVCLFLLLVSLLASSCQVLFPNYLLREDKKFTYTELVDTSAVAQTLMRGDIITFQLSTRNGYGFVDVIERVGTSGGNNQGSSNQTIHYVVRPDGIADFPLIGEVNVTGMTRLQLQALLEEKYSVIYNDPFIVLSVTNRRAFVFLGRGSARVIALPTENTTLIEVIALAGGLTADSKARKIRVIRGDYDHPMIKKVNLATISGLKDADMIIQPYDLIVVEPTTQIAPELLRQLTPILTLVTTLTTIILLVKR
ncbi:hypothetical protein BH09BAC1_BH09BAC1_01220 [soil metagenome]